MGNICAHQMQRRFCKCETTDRKTWLINERRVSSTIVDSHGLLAFGNRCKINHHQMLWVCALCSRRINEWENGKFECRKCMSTNFTPSLNSFRVQTHVLRNIKQSTHTHTNTYKANKVASTSIKIFTRNHTKRRENYVHVLHICMKRGSITKWFVCRMHTKYQYHIYIWKGHLFVFQIVSF